MEWNNDEFNGVSDGKIKNYLLLYFLLSFLFSSLHRILLVLLYFYIRAIEATSKDGEDGQR